MMEKRLLTAALLLMLLAALPEPVRAADEKSTEIVCEAQEADDDGVCDVSVELHNGAGIAMMQFALRYDPAMLACIDAESGELLSDTLPPDINTGIPGMIYFIWDALEPLESDGEVLHLRIQPLTETESWLEFDFGEDFIFADGDFEEKLVYAGNCLMPGIDEEGPEISDAEGDALDDEAHLSGQETGSDPLPDWICGAALILPIALCGGAVLLRRKGKDSKKGEERKYE